MRVPGLRSINDRLRYRNPNLTALLLKRQFASGSSRVGAPANASQAYRAVDSWAESDSLKRCSASYCQLNPPPRSTIAAAFSPDGQLVASTHGDHTVKVICVRTGKCLQTLTGHRRTPWVVRFHPTSSTLLASGSLDYEVRLWNARTAECINVHNFGRPIASLAFHIEGDALAVASGHKLYMWQYTKQQQGEEGAPPVALKTRRSLRAVHFHPLGLPLVLTAEVNDVNTPVTLPHGAPSLEEVAAAAETAHESAHQMPSEPEPARVQFSDAMHREAEAQHAQRTQPHRRLSEVFRAMMDEEHEEELLAQLESSVNLHTGQSQASASRQILHLAGRADTQPVFGHASARLSTRHSMDTPVTDSMPFRRPRARQPAYHPLAHIEDQDEPSFRVHDSSVSGSLPIATPLRSMQDAIPSARSSARASGSAESSSARQNATQQMAQSWMHHRQQERSVLNTDDSGGLDVQPVRPDRSPGRLLSRHSMHSAAPQAFNHQVPTRSTSLTDAASSSFTRRLSEPPRSLDEEWPVVGTPPVNFPKNGSLHLPPPSPSRQGPRVPSPPQGEQPTQPSVAPFGLPSGWAAGLARGAEWMGEATGLRFLARPFQRSTPDEAADGGSSHTSPPTTRQPQASVSPVRRHSIDNRGLPLPLAPSPRTSPVRATRQASMQSNSSQDNRPFSASAPGHSSMSYRERLLAGAAAIDAPFASFSHQSGQMSQVGFPSQQELQASQARLSHQSPASASFSNAQHPAGHLSQLVPPANQSEASSTSMYTQASQGFSAPASGAHQEPTAPHDPMPSQHQQQPAEQAVQFRVPSTAASALPDFNWPAQVTLNGQLLEAQQNVAAALPPSMLNMGWEYPAQLLQGADPVLTARHRGGREDAAQQPNIAVANAVRASAAAANIIGTEQPCRVRLRLWHCSAADPTAALEAPSLTIPDAVLCSEMGVHFSACGRYLAACVACQAEHLQELQPDAAGIIYEVRVYSLEAATLGEVLHARQIRAAHCLTSVQFSPTSEHLLLAYGRRHISLLRSLVPDGTSSIIPVHTILEVYRVSDMSLVRVLPSAEDEVNAATFHPHPGGGIAYGTKEGKLRILRHDPRPEARTLATCQRPRGLQDELREAESIYEDEVLL